MKYPVVIAPEYLAELRRRIEAGPGVTAVAKAARMSRMTLWGLLNNEAASAPRATNDAVERARLALATLEPGAEPMPPAVASVRDSDHHRWIAIGAGGEPGSSMGARAPSHGARNGMTGLNIAPQVSRRREASHRLAAA